MYKWFCIFFFFKQKTAYEIGTGDWSSDVCSSDLVYKATRAPTSDIESSAFVFDEGNCSLVRTNSILTIKFLDRKSVV